MWTYTLYITLQKKSDKKNITKIQSDYSVLNF